MLLDIFLHIVTALIWPLHLIYIDLVTMIGFAQSKRDNLMYHAAAVFASLSAVLIVLSAWYAVLDHEFLGIILSWEQRKRFIAYIIPGVVYSIFNKEKLKDSLISVVIRLFVSVFVGVLLTALFIGNQ